MTNARNPAHPIEPLFVQRWSPRAFTATPLPRADALRILEAARWAPSAYNAQPWRFALSLRGDAYWDSTLSVLDPFNRGWACNAGALVTVFSDRSAASHHFDAGAAWAHLALQATAMGYAAHAMAGFDQTRAREAFRVPDDFDIEVLVAIGQRGAAETLPVPLRAREQPSARRPLSDSVGEGRFPR
jgi:nitroreductase